MKKICVVTGTRAEYGLLKPVMEKIQEDEQLQLQVVATGSHLSPEFGLTYQEIEKDGFFIDEKVEILMSSDSPVGITKTMGLAMISFGEVFQRLSPDMVVLLGDRYEIYAVAGAAHVSNIPIAHISGGEITEGLLDDAFRHCITKMSYLHFVANEEYCKRVIQLGEAPERVFNVGDTGVENIKSMTLLSKVELEKEIGFEFDKKVALLTYHPVTLEENSSYEYFKNLLDAISEIEGLKVIFTKANADTYGRIINEMIDEYVDKHPDMSVAFTSMGQLRYLSAMKYSDLVIGNSSSGIVEAPTLGKPTVNIGQRQKGRMKAVSVIDCGNTKKDIKEAIEKALSEEFRRFMSENRELIYGDGQSVSSKIVETMKKVLYSENISLMKKFYDLE